MTGAPFPQYTTSPTPAAHTRTAPAPARPVFSHKLQRRTSDVVVTASSSSSSSSTSSRSSRSSRAPPHSSSPSTATKVDQASAATLPAHSESATASKAARTPHSTRPTGISPPAPRPPQPSAPSAPSHTVPNGRGTRERASCADIAGDPRGRSRGHAEDDVVPDKTSRVKREDDSSKQRQRSSESSSRDHSLGERSAAASTIAAEQLREVGTRPLHASAVSTLSHTERLMRANAFIARVRERSSFSAVDIVDDQAIPLTKVLHSRENKARAREDVTLRAEILTGDGRGRLVKREQGDVDSDSRLRKRSRDAEANNRDFDSSSRKFMRHTCDERAVAPAESDTPSWLRADRTSPPTAAARQLQYDSDQAAYSTNSSGRDRPVHFARGDGWLSHQPAVPRVSRDRSQVYDSRRERYALSPRHPACSGTSPPTHKTPLRDGELHASFAHSPYSWLSGSPHTPTTTHTHTPSPHPMRSHSTNRPAVAGLTPAASRSRCDEFTPHATLHIGTPYAEHDPADTPLWLRGSTAGESPRSGQRSMRDYAETSAGRGHSSGVRATRHVQTTPRSATPATVWLQGLPPTPPSPAPAPWMAGSR